MQIREINSLLFILHDAIFVGLEDNIKTNSSKLTFLLEDEQTTINILLSGINSSRCIDWKFANIVLDASVYSNTNNIERLIELICHIEELTEIQIQNNVYSNLLNDIVNQNKYIFEINPSYGAYFTAIVQDLQIVKPKVE